MADGLSINPEATAVEISPDKARGSVEAAATDVLGILKTIATKQGEVDAIQLDLLDEDGSTADTEFRGEAFGTQNLVLSDLFGIKQKIYMQTDASRLAELGSLSSRVYQKKYSTLARLMAEDLSRGKITQAEYLERQEAMILGQSAAGLTLAAIIDNYKQQVVAGKSRLVGFDSSNLPGMFQEEVGFQELTSTGQLTGSIVKKTISAKFNEDGLINPSTSANSRSAEYFAELTKQPRDTDLDLLSKLASRKISVPDFLNQQRKLVDNLLDSNPLQSIKSYTDDQKAKIDALLSDTLSQKWTAAITAINNSGNNTWNNVQTQITTLMNELLAFTGLGADGKKGFVTGSGQDSIYEYNRISANFNFDEINDGNDAYGVDTNIDTAARIFNGIVFKSDNSISSMKKVMNYIASLADKPNPTATELKLQAVGKLSEKQLNLFTLDRFQGGVYPLSKDKQINLNTVLSDLAAANIHTITGLSPGQYFYQTTEGIPPEGTIAFNVGSAKVLGYQGLNFAVPDNVFSTLEGLKTGAKTLADCSADETAALQAFVIELHKAAIVEKQLQTNISVVLKDNRTITDVINGDKRLEAVDYSQLSETEKLFAGTNARAHSVAEIVQAKLDLAENEYIPELDLGGELQRNYGLVPLHDANGFAVNEHLLQPVLLNANKQVTAFKLDNGQLLDPSTYTISTTGALVRKNSSDFLPLINAKGETIAMADLKRKSNGQLVVPVQDTRGNTIKLLTSDGQPIFKLRVNTDEAKQNMVLNPSNQQREVVNSPVLNKGKLVAPEFMPILQDSSGSYFMAGSKRINVNDKNEITSIDGVSISEMDLAGIIKAGKEEIALHYNQAGKFLAPDAALINKEVLDTPDYQGLSRDVFYFGNNNNRKMAVMDETGTFIETFYSVDTKGRKQAWSPEPTSVVRNKASGELIPLIDPESKTAIVQLQMKRSNQAQMLFAVEDYTANKQNAQYISAKLPEARTDGSLPDRDLPAPALNATVSAMVIAKLGSELVQRANNIKEININTSEITDRKTSLITAVNQFNQTAVSTAKQDLINVITTQFYTAEKKAELAKLQTAYQTAVDKLPGLQSAHQGASGDLDTAKQNHDSAKKAADDANKAYNSAVTKAAKSQNDYDVVKAKFDQGVEGVSQADVDNSKSTSDRDAAAKATSLSAKQAADRSKADKLTALAEANNSFNNKQTELENAQKAVIEATTALKDAVVKMFDSKAGGDSSIESLAKKYIQESNENDQTTIGKALNSVRSAVEGFSKDINALSSSIDTTYGSNTSNRNAEAKKLRELVLLTLIFSIFEQSEWEDAQADADPSRYQVTDDG